MFTLKIIDLLSHCYCLTSHKLLNSSTITQNLCSHRFPQQLCDAWLPSRSTSQASLLYLCSVADQILFDLCVGWLDIALTQLHRKPQFWHNNTSPCVTINSSCKFATKCSYPKGHYILYGPHLLWYMLFLSDLCFYSFILSASHLLYRSPASICGASGWTLHPGYIQAWNQPCGPLQDFLSWYFCNTERGKALSYVL